MGGGGVMKNVAGIPSILTGENASAHKASRPVSVNDGVIGAGLFNRHEKSWELEEWEVFYHDDDELTLKSSSVRWPRVVFGSVPSMEEAKKAVLDLKDALETVYLKSPTASTESEDSFSVKQEINLPILRAKSEFSNTATACVTRHDYTAPYAVQAYKFLTENPDAQTVVSSIASDPNVFNAVMQNSEVSKYIKSQCIIGNGFSKDMEKNGVGLRMCVEKLKCNVVDMVSKLSGFIQENFGSFTAKKNSKDWLKLDQRADTTVTGSSFMGPAVFVILLVVLKRVNLHRS